MVGARWRQSPYTVNRWAGISLANGRYLSSVLVIQATRSFVPSVIPICVNISSIKERDEERGRIASVNDYSRGFNPSSVQQSSIPQLKMSALRLTRCFLFNSGAVQSVSTIYFNFIDVVIFSANPNSDNLIFSRSLQLIMSTFSGLISKCAILRLCR